VSQISTPASAGFGFAQPAEDAPFPPLPKGFRGGLLPLKTPFFGVRCQGTALESGDSSPHPKRKSTKKDCYGDKVANFADSLLLLVLLIDGGQAVLCALGLFGGGNRGFSNPCFHRLRGEGATTTPEAFLQISLATKKEAAFPITVTHGKIWQI